MPQREAPRPDGRVGNRRGRRRGRKWLPGPVAEATRQRLGHHALVRDPTDPEGAAVLDAVVQALRQGNYLDTASALAGISHETLKGWLTQGARDFVAGERTDYAVFWARIAASLAEAEATDVARMNRAAQRDWRAAAWVLERRWPERWSSRAQVAIKPVAGDGDEPTWNLAALSVPQLATLLELAQFAQAQETAIEAEAVPVGVPAAE